MTHWNEIEEKHNALVLLLRNKDILDYNETNELLTEKCKKEQLEILFKSGENNERKKKT